MENELLKAALAYAARGWHLLPCREKQGQPYWSDKKQRICLPKSKHPYIPNGVNAASTDPDQIRAWWTRWPRAAIGCNCGKSGLFAFDLDMKDGRNGWAVFRDLGIDHTQAYHSVTPSGGIHIIYTGHGKSSANTQTGVDTRGEGGYIILPPSLIDGAGDYFAADDWDRTPQPGPLPEGVLELLFPPKPTTAAKPIHPLSPEAQVQRARRAVRALDPARARNYQDWIQVGMALAELGQDGLTLWHEFSAHAPEKYAPAVLDEKWTSFRAGSGLTLGSLFHWAEQDTPNWWRQTA